MKIKFAERFLIYYFVGLACLVLGIAFVRYW